MRLHVFFNPAELAAVGVSARDVYIIIDAIRATTTMTILLDQGASRVLAANTVVQARDSMLKIPGRALCGEQKGQPIAGFDYGNSPAEFSEMDLTGREMVWTTSNGTRAFFACPDGSIRLAGCFYNAEAVTSLALRLAEEYASNINIVCAAEYGYFALEDATCGGYLAFELLRQNPRLKADDSVHAATTLYQIYAPPRLLEYSSAGAELIELGMQKDLPYCLSINGSRTVAKVVRKEEETGLLLLERAC